MSLKTRYLKCNKDDFDIGADVRLKTHVVLRRVFADVRCFETSVLGRGVSPDKQCL